MRNIGYETDNSFLNLGSLALLEVLYLIQLILLVILKLVVKFTGKYKNTYNSLFNQVFFFTILKLSIEGYFEFLISGILNTYYSVHYDLLGDRLALPLSYFSLMISIFLLPCCLVRMLLLSQDEIDEQSFKERYSPLLHEIKLNRSKWNHAYFLLFCTRRFIFVLVSFLMASLPQFQLIITIFFNELIIIYQGTFMPLDCQQKNFLELFNEFSIITASLHFICFTDFVPNLEAQEIVGWSLNFLIMLTLAVNLFKIFKITIHKVNLVKKKYQARIMKKLNEFKQKLELKNDNNNAQQQIDKAVDNTKIKNKEDNQNDCEKQIKEKKENELSVIQSEGSKEDESEDRQSNSSKEASIKSQKNKGINQNSNLIQAITYQNILNDVRFSRMYKIKLNNRQMRNRIKTESNYELSQQDSIQNVKQLSQFTTNILNNS